MPFPFLQRGTPAPVLSQSPTIESKASYGLTTGLNRGLYPISTQKHLAHGWKLTCLMSIPGQLQVNQYALDSYKANLVSFSPQSRLHHTRGQHPASNWFPVLIQPDADPWPIQCQCGFWSNPEPVPHLSQSMLIQCQTTNALPITRLQDDMPIHHWSAPKHANQLQPTHIIGMTLDWHQMTGHWRWTCQSSANPRPVT